jgi:3-oxoacyl-[acyl-carrier-protein] synthase II
MSSSDRVVVTGTGWVTPLGHDIATVWKRLLNAESGMAPITRFNAQSFPTKFAAEVREYDVANEASSKSPT